MRSQSRPVTPSLASNSLAHYCPPGHCFHLRPHPTPFRFLRGSLLRTKALSLGSQGRRPHCGQSAQRLTRLRLSELHTLLLLFKAALKSLRIPTERPCAGFGDPGARLGTPHSQQGAPKVPGLATDLCLPGSAQPERSWPGQGTEEWPAAGSFRRGPQ